MAEWITPVTDRTVADTTAARREQSNAENNKGALNYQDLNRIEGNYRYLLEKLEGDSFFIPHRYRNYEETTIEKTEVYPDLDYTPVEYIESSGTQWIDTGFKHNQNTRVLMDVQAVSIGANVWVFEGRISTGSARKGILFYYTSDKLWYMDYETERISFPGIGQTDRLHIDYDKNKCTINGVEKTATAKDFQSTYNLTLLASNTGGKIGGMIAARLYSCKIYDNDVLIRDYIPVKDPSGVACLYEKVSKSFYRNAGTGEFAAGAEIPVAPTTEYAEVKRTYTDWQERNIPWLSEINRIRANYNALVRLFLIGLGLPLSSESNYLAYQEVNDWERIALTGKEMFENMAQEYIPCGTMDSGGDRLL